MNNRGQKGESFDKPKKRDREKEGTPPPASKKGKSIEEQAIVNQGTGVLANANPGTQVNTVPIPAERKDNTSKISATERRLDSLARILQGRDKCVAVCFSNNQFIIAANNLHYVQETNIVPGHKKYINKIMGYFREIAKGNHPDNRGLIVKKIAIENLAHNESSHLIINPLRIYLAEKIFENVTHNRKETAQNSILSKVFTEVGKAEGRQEVIKIAIEEAQSKLQKTTHKIKTRYGQANQETTLTARKKILIDPAKTISTLLSSLDVLLSLIHEEEFRGEVFKLKLELESSIIHPIKTESQKSIPLATIVKSRMKFYEAAPKKLDALELLLKSVPKPGPDKILSYNYGAAYIEALTMWNLARAFVKIEKSLGKESKVFSNDQKKAFKSKNGYEVKRIDKEDVHAELRILTHLLNNKNPLTYGQELYIGISKLCCIDCRVSIEAVNKYFSNMAQTTSIGSNNSNPPLFLAKDTVVTRGSHTLAFDKNWVPPAFFAKIPKIKGLYEEFGEKITSLKIGHMLQNNSPSGSAEVSFSQDTPKELIQSMVQAVKDGEMEPKDIIDQLTNGVNKENPFNQFENEQYKYSFRDIKLIGKVILDSAFRNSGPKYIFSTSLNIYKESLETYNSNPSQPLIGLIKENNNWIVFRCYEVDGGKRVIYFANYTPGKDVSDFSFPDITFTHYEQDQPHEEELPKAFIESLYSLDLISNIDEVSLKADAKPILTNNEKIDLKELREKYAIFFLKASFVQECEHFKRIHKKLASNTDTLNAVAFEETMSNLNIDEKFLLNLIKHNPNLATEIFSLDTGLHRAMLEYIKEDLVKGFTEATAQNHAFRELSKAKLDKNFYDKFTGILLGLISDGSLNNTILPSLIKITGNAINVNDLQTQITLNILSEAIAGQLQSKEPAQSPIR